MLLSFFHIFKHPHAHDRKMSSTTEQQGGLSSGRREGVLDGLLCSLKIFENRRACHESYFEKSSFAEAQSFFLCRKKAS